jgi:hypothetical protein
MPWQRSRRTPGGLAPVRPNHASRRGAPHSRSWRAAGSRVGHVRPASSFGDMTAERATCAWDSEVAHRRPHLPGDAEETGSRSATPDRGQTSFARVTNIEPPTGRVSPPAVGRTVSGVASTWPFLGSLPSGDFRTRPPMRLRPASRGRREMTLGAVQAPVSRSSTRSKNVLQPSVARSYSSGDIEPRCSKSISVRPSPRSVSSTVTSSKFSSPG